VRDTPEFSPGPWARLPVCLWSANSNNTNSHLSCPARTDLVWLYVQSHCEGGVGLTHAGEALQVHRSSRVLVQATLLGRRSAFFRTVCTVALDALPASLLLCLVPQAFQDTHRCVQLAVIGRKASWDWEQARTFAKAASLLPRALSLFCDVLLTLLF
jgi:hypothetical protein